MSAAAACSKASSATGGFVLAAPVLPGSARRTSAMRTGADGMPHGVVTDPHVFVAIDKDGIVTIVGHRAEMGTGVRTSLPMVVADELEADWTHVQVVAGAGRRGEIRQPGHRRLAQHAPFHAADAPVRRRRAADAGRRPPRNAGASTSTRSRRTTTRSCTRRPARSSATANSPPTRPRCRCPRPTTLRLKDPRHFRYIGKGKSTSSICFDITTGKAGYGQDVRLPGTEIRRRRPPAGGRRQGRVV